MSNEPENAAEFRIEPGKTHPDGSRVLILSGPLDQDAAPGVADELCERLAAGERRLYLHMQGVTFLSSAGVGSLISSITAFRDEQGDIILQDVPSGVLHVFELLCLQDYVTLEEAPIQT